MEEEKEIQKVEVINAVMLGFLIGIGMFFANLLLLVVTLSVFKNSIW